MEFKKTPLKTRTKRSILKQDEQKTAKPKGVLHPSLEENKKKIKEMTGNSDDIVIREIRVGKGGRLKVGIFYTDGLIDQPSYQNFILETLMVDLKNSELDHNVSYRDNPLTYIKESVLTVGKIVEVMDYDSLFTSLLSGSVILLFDGYTEGFDISMNDWESLGVTEATGEPTVRGPKESLTENIRTNTALIRRKITSPKLWFETKRIGTVTKTIVSIGYIKGTVKDKIVEEARRRLDKIEIDSILDSGYIEELIQDETFTPFPTTFITERPDVIAGNLLEGRIVILVDGTPQAIIVPALFVQFFQTADDYYARTDISTLIRLLRFLGFFIALLAPSIFIAITTFNQELLPTPLLISLAAQREGVPFPTFVEALLMEITFEILREAGLRMPRAVGQALSIVGTLVVGTAAVEAGIVSAAMVIVVSITAISSFVISSFNFAISVRILRFPFIGLSASFGLFGIFIGMIGLILHLCSLRSFGVPYMSPVAPFIVEDQKDALFRLPHWALFSRPRLIGQKKGIREDTSSPKPD